MSCAEREHISLLRRHLHAAGGLAQVVADAVSPLAVAQSLQVGKPRAGIGQLTCCGLLSPRLHVPTDR